MNFVFSKGVASDIIEYVVLRSIYRLLSKARYIMKSILVIYQELSEKYFDMFFGKKGNLNRHSAYLAQKRMSVRSNIVFVFLKVHSIDSIGL